MDTLLTLVIALGGIATGIGAIWTAMLGRRQLNEQRRFLGEQNDRARLTLEFDPYQARGPLRKPALLGKEEKRRRAHHEHLLRRRRHRRSAGLQPRGLPRSQLLRRGRLRPQARGVAPNRCGIPSAYPLGCTGPCMGRPSARCERNKTIPPCTKVSSD
jgi:hypothetical protein